MNDFLFKIRVGLIDGFSSGYRGITAMLRGVLSPLQSIRAGAMGAAGAFKQLGIAGTLVAGLSFAAPISAAGAFETKLTDIAITAGYSGNAARSMVADLNSSYSQLALKVGQTGSDVAKGAQILIAGGIELPIVNQLLPAIGKAATAAGASMEDISKTALALQQNMKLEPAEFEKVFAELATAGKLGRFELKDMAAEFPSLAASAASIGLKGAEGARTLAASLQMAIKGAGSSSEAANNLKNFLEKIGSKEVRENFKKVGIDITSVLDDAAAKGLNPFEAVMQKIRGMMGAAGGDAAKVAKLTNVFADMQVLSFLKPFLADIEGYKDIKNQMAGADVEILDKDADTRMQTIEGRMTRIKEMGGQLADRVGRGFAPLLDFAISGLGTAQKLINLLDTEIPGLTDGVISVVGPLMAIIAGAGALSMVLPPIIAGFSALGIIAGVILGPAGLLIGALALGAYLIWKNWDQLSGRFGVLWDGIKAIFESAVAVIRALFAGDGFALKEAFGRLVGDVNMLMPVLSSLFNSIGNLISGAFAAAWDAVKMATMNAIWAILTALDVDMGKAADIVMKLGDTFDIVGTAIANTVRGMVEFIKSIFSGDLAGAFDALKGIVTNVFSAIGQLIDTWTGGALTKSIDTIRNMFSSVRSFFGFTEATPATTASAAPSTTAPPGVTAPAGSASQVGGQITVKVDGPGKVTDVQSVNPSVPLEADRGALFGMPM